MKKLMIALAVGLMTTACQKVDITTDENGSPIENTKGSKKFTFTVKGDFTTEYAPITRGYLQADGKDMTDLWVIDMVNGSVVQSLHQSSTDADFGAPSMQLTFGSHKVYFCASRGTAPTWSEDKLGLSWQKVNDTFWKEYDVDVVQTSNGNRAVTLDRSVARMRVQISDKVPVGVRALRVKTVQGSKQMSMLTGFGSLVDYTQDLDVYASDEGKLLPDMLVYTTCPSDDEWTVDVTLQYLDANGSVMYSRSVPGVGLLKNRESKLMGAMVDASNGFQLSLDAEWVESSTVEF